MSDRVETAIHQIAEYFAAIMGVIGVAMMAVALVWWVYQSIQQGMAPMELGELGGSLVLIAIGVKLTLNMITMDRDGEEMELKGVFEDER